MNGQFTILKKDGCAKRGRFETVHGTIETPVFMNVGGSTDLLDVTLVHYNDGI